MAEAQIPFGALLAGETSTCHYEARYLTKAGETRWIEVFARLVRDSAGAISGTAGTLNDVTDRREALDGLRDSELRYAEKSQILSITLENIDQGILMVAADGTVPVSNHRVIELLELPPGLLLDRPPYQKILDYEVSIGEFEGVDPEVVALCMKGGAISEPHAWERTRPNGRTIEFRTVPLAGGGIVRTYTDVTERHAGENALRRAKELAEQSSRTRTAFLATLSHEIRTPLNGVIGLIDLLLATALDPAQSGYVRGLAASAEHLLLIIDDVLDFTKLDADRLELEKVPFDLFDLINGTIEMLEPRAASKQITIAGELPISGPRYFRGDPKRIRQVLLNVAGNAVKFTDHGGVVIALTVETGGIDARISLSIKDTGIGIPPEARDRLFHEFSQVDSSITRRFGGTGLGLAICKRLIDAMGGQIALTSEADWDTVFQIDLSLPISSLAELPTAIAEDQPVSLEKGLRILLAEDNQTNQIVARAALEKYGCTVDIAVNGRQAVEAVRDRAYDLVLMDLMMPEMGGLEAARQIRELPGLGRQVPMIAMSASAATEDRIACAEAGMDGFIAKPFVPSKMVAQIRNVLSDRKAGGLFMTSAPAKETAEAAEDVNRQILADLFSSYGDMANTFIDAFMTETGKRLRRMDELIAQRRPSELVLDAHSLKGSALTFGCARLSLLAGEIEHGAATNADLEWPALLEALKGCFDRTSILLRNAAEAAAPASG
jgi:signal transduction histidine kinase/DNA-binding response OmpR family regulator